MNKNNPRQAVARARERLKNKKVLSSQDDISLQDDRFPAAEIHTEFGAGREIIKRIPAKEIDPKRCKPWEYHNRDKGWLNKERCKDLIQSITKNGQQEPVLVRAIKDDKEHDYEVIYGVRRWFACCHIHNQKLLAKVTVADDRECFILMHVENFDSKDITEFERAVSFKRQLDSGHFENQKDLAEAMNLSNAIVSRMMLAASMYDYGWLKCLFPSMIDVSVRKAHEIGVLLKQKHSKNALKEKAEYLYSKILNGEKFSTINILKELLSIGKADEFAWVQKKINELKSMDGVNCKIDSQGRFVFYVSSNMLGKNKKQILHAIEGVLNSYEQN